MTNQPAPGPSWVRPCSPGPRPVWVAPNAETGEQLVTWAEPADMHCVDCAWRVGPEVTEPPGGIPFEIITTRGPNPGSTGVSMLDVLGEATWMLAMLVRLRGYQFGLCFQALRLPCGCGQPVCGCNGNVDLAWLPDDTYSVDRVLIDGFEIPEYNAALAVTPVDPGNSAVATVTWQTNGWTVHGVAPGETTIRWSVPTQTGTAEHSTSVVVVAANDPTFVGVNSTRAVVRVGANQVWATRPRANWQIRITSDGKRRLARLNPWSTCPGGQSSCGCCLDAATPRWPHRQNLTLDATEEGTWQIELLRGEPVPELGRVAVADLACELARRVAGEPCRIPPEVTRLIRGGVAIDMKRIRGLSGVTEGWGFDSVQRFIELSCPARFGFIDLEANDPYGPANMNTPGSFTQWGPLTQERWPVAIQQSPMP